jgi:cytochrome P450
MNNPSSLDLSRDWMPLDSKSPPTLLVYGDELAKQVLKADTIASYNLVSYWKRVSKMGEERLPAIEGLFERTPLFLNGPAHTKSRRQIMGLYKQTEARLDSWLPSFCQVFFDENTVHNPIEPVYFVSNFLEQLSKNIFAKNLGVKPEDLPGSPQTLFQMLARAENLRAYNETLQKLCDTTIKYLKLAERDPMDVWALASISVMGREPILGALVYALTTEPKKNGVWDAETLLHISAPVSMLGRDVVSNCEIEGLKLTQGQMIYICPYLIHLRGEKLYDSQPKGRNNREQTSFSFGFGAHICPGRKISLRIIREFLRQLARQPAGTFDTTGVKLVRDFTLIPVNTNH